MYTRHFLGFFFSTVLLSQAATAASFVFTNKELASGETHVYEIMTTPGTLPGLDALVGALTFDLFAPSGSSDDADTILSIVDPDTQTLIVANDDAVGLASSVSTFLTASDTYWVLVSGFPNAFDSPSATSNQTGYSLAIFNDVASATFIGSQFAVPLPASVVMLCSALGLTSLFSRRRVWQATAQTAATA